MTKVIQPQAPASFPYGPPDYPTVAETNVNETQEKELTPCEVHGASQTPYLDAYLRQDSTRTHINALSLALGDVLHGDGCTKCATEKTARTLAEYLRDLRAAKKSGQWSRAEKKALKAEVKGLMKEMKRDLKTIWKEKPQN